MSKKFPTQYDKREGFTTEAGNAIMETYTSKWSDDGSLTLEVTGQISLYDEIQSHKDSVDIHVLLKRYADGDISALDRVKGVYADITEMPQNYAEMFNKINEGKALFDSLSVEMKEKFNNSFEEFLITSDKPEFFEKLGLIDLIDTEKLTPNTYFV